MTFGSLVNIHGITGFLFTSVLLVSITTLFAKSRGYKTVVLRGVEIIATLQFLFGISLVVWLFILGGFRAPLHFWLHIVFALTTLRLVGMFVTRALGEEVKRKQNIVWLSGVIILALATLTIGYFGITI